MQLHAVYKKPSFFLQVMQESVSVLSHTRICIITTSDMRESVSGSTSHPRYIRTCNEITGLCNKIIINIVPSDTKKNSLILLPLALLLVQRTRNNTDGNKLISFNVVCTGANELMIDSLSSALA